MAFQLWEKCLQHFGFDKTTQQSIATLIEYQLYLLPEISGWLRPSLFPCYWTFPMCRQGCLSTAS
jgi:hypothetical protein